MPLESHQAAKVGGQPAMSHHMTVWWTAGETVATRPDWTHLTGVRSVPGPGKSLQYYRTIKALKINVGFREKVL